VARFFAGAGFGGLWIAFIGWFLLTAAGATHAQLAATERLRGVRVGDVMSRDCALVDGTTSVQDFVDEHLLRTGRRCFIVLENGRVAGLVTPLEIRQVDRREWPATPVRAVMQRLDRLHTVSPETPVTESLQVMGRHDVHQLPVVKDGRLEGVISRGHILQLLQTRAQLNM
jgi:CBS domain-containing protein